MMDNLTGGGKVLNAEQEFDKALDYFQTRRENSERNWGMYSGFDNGQWQKSAVAELSKQNRHVAQYNFIRGKVDNLAGAINKNDLDIDYVPVDGETSEYTRILKGLFYADKELMDWKIESLQTVVDGLVYSGMEEMYVSDKFNALGNIGFRRILPGLCVVDPNWKTHKSEDLKSVWKVAYLTPEEIKLIYPGRSDRIDQMIARMATQGADYEHSEESSSIPYFNLEQIYGTQYRVIEHHHIKETNKNVEIIVGDNGKISVPDNMSDGEKEALMEEVGNGVLLKRRKIVREYWVTTSCSQLDQTEFLENKKAELQIGRLPFFPWSAARINGRDSGIVDLLVDAQQSINKRESLSDHMIASSAHGAMAVDPAMFGGDVGKTKDFIANMDKPNARAITDTGALASGRHYTELIQKAQYSGEIYQEIERMSTYLDKISKSTATMEGRGESSHDTGILFARRQMQSEIALTTLTRSYEQHWNDKGEAYMLACQQLYSGAYREFNTNFGNVKGEQQVIAINYDQTEQVPMDLKYLPRHKVVVSQSPNGVTVQATERAINSEIQANTPNEFYLSKAVIQKQINSTINLSDEDKQQSMMASELEYQAALERMQTDIVSMQTARAQAEMQLQQMQQQTMMGEQQLAQGEQQLQQPQEGAPQEEQQPQL